MYISKIYGITNIVIYICIYIFIFICIFIFIEFRDGIIGFVGFIERIYLTGKRDDHFAIDGDIQYMILVRYMALLILYNIYIYIYNFKDDIILLITNYVCIYIYIHTYVY